MSFSKIIAALICLMLSAIIFLPACAAFEDTVMVLEKKNISLNLPAESEYNISRNASVSMVMQAISINSTMPMGKNASIILMSMNIEGDENEQLNQTEFSSFIENLFMGGIRLANGREIKSTVVNSSQGENVTLHTILMPAAKNKPAEESIFAFWDLDQYTHAILTSELDLNTTASIVETLKITP